MNSKKSKKKTISLIDVMILHAGKGPSGFRTNDYEECGKPNIFPEFDEGSNMGNIETVSNCV